MFDSTIVIESGARTLRMGTASGEQWSVAPNAAVVRYDDQSGGPRENSVAPAMLLGAAAAASASAEHLRPLLVGGVVTDWVAQARLWGARSLETLVRGAVPSFLRHPKGALTLNIGMPRNRWCWACRVRKTTGDGRMAVAH